MHGTQISQDISGDNKNLSLKQNLFQALNLNDIIITVITTYIACFILYYVNTADDNSLIGPSLPLHCQICNMFHASRGGRNKT